MSRVVCLAASFALLVGIAHAEPPAGYAFRSYPEALRSATASGKHVFLYLGRHGCGYCEKTNKESFSNDNLHTRLGESFELAYVDSEGNGRLQLPSGERLTEAAFAERLNALGTPVFFALEPDGTEITRLYGFQSAEALLAFQEYIVAKHYKMVSFRNFIAAGDQPKP
ncbi:MAG: thioredoxin fold domain-containing protein [Gammaproteobacteria bacterium]|nr:thioredoxin fold domain-containing protein [Gammaproteobacteria bacterium]